MEIAAKGKVKMVSSYFGYECNLCLEEYVYALNIMKTDTRWAICLSFFD